MEDEHFSTETLSSHLQTDRRRRRNAFTDGGKAHFHDSLGFGLFR